MSMSCSSCKDKSRTREGDVASMSLQCVLTTDLCPLYSRALLGSPQFPWGNLFLLSQLPSLSLDYTSDMMANRNSVIPGQRTALQQYLA